MAQTTRRQFLRATLLLGAGAGAGAALVACGQPEAAPAWAAAPASPGAGTPVGTPPDIPLTATAVALVPTKPGGIPTPVSTPDGPVRIPTTVSAPDPQYRPTPDHPLPPQPTQPPEAPISVAVIADGSPNATRATRQATLVALGTVRQVLPARWNTSGGGRPANPHSQESRQRDTIFTPVVVQVERYLKGSRPQPQVHLFANGGTVGRDSVRYSGPVTYTFREGERVVVFLQEDQLDPAAPDGGPFWLLIDQRYLIDRGDQATDGVRTISLQQLLDEIAAAQR